MPRLTNKPIVLIVDDDMTNIRILARLLEPEFEVVPATSALQALDVIPHVLPDLILLDVVMPDMDGYALCVQLKADAATAAIPIIFVTGLQDSDAESHGLELGAADFVTKPFIPNVVRARVRNNVELKRARDRLLALAATDGMTGLFNRRAMDSALERELKRSARVQAPLALVMLDVDAFKAFNDRYGHIAGDDCLRQIAGEVAASLHRPADIAARFGGEEFLCILPDTGIDAALAVARRIEAGIERLAIPHGGSDVSAVVTASFGVVSHVGSQEMSADGLLLAVDSCLYEAKAAGRDRIVARDLPARR